MKSRIAVILLTAVLCAPLFAAERQSITTLFPSLKVTGDPSFTIIIDGDKALPHTLPANPLGAWLSAAVEKQNRSFVVESLRLIPYPAGYSVDRERIFDAIRQIRLLSGRTYHSSSRGKDVPLFEEATRIDSIKKENKIDDGKPRTATTESALIRLKDANFGKTYYSMRVDASYHGMLLELRNVEPLSYGFVNVVDENEFFTILYIEPVAEGLVIYAVGGAKVGSFIAKKVNMPSATRKRLNVIIDWITDGIDIMQ